MDIFKKEKKRTCAVYISNEYPLRFEQFLPILHILAKGNHLLSSLEQILNEKEVNKLLVREGFPVKIVIPVSFSIEAVVTFLVHRKLEEDSDMECFAIPKYN